MAKLTELKTLILCAFLVAVASLIARFSYTVNFARCMKAGRAPVVFVINDTQWSRRLQEMSKGQVTEQTTVKRSLFNFAPIAPQE